MQSNALKRLVYAVDHFEECVVIMCMTGMAVFTFAGVVARFVFHFPIAGADELSMYLFVWSAFFGAAVGFKHNRHGSVPLIADRLPVNVRRHADRAVWLLMGLLFLLISYYCWSFLKTSFMYSQTSPATGLPGWVINAGLVLALLLCALRCFEPLVREFFDSSEKSNFENKRKYARISQDE